jgi:hypothetical protein
MPRDKIGILISIFLLLTFMVMLPNVIVRGSPEEVLGGTLLFENFEGYKAGSFPLSGGWIPLCFEHAPPTHVVVENSCVDQGIIVDYSPTKSLRLWEGGAERFFDTDASIIGFEAYVMVEKASGSWPRCTVGFVDRGRTTYTGVVFLGSDSSNWVEGYSWWDHRIVLSSFSPNKWYKVRLILDRSRDTFSVWINDELGATNILTDKSRRVDTIELGASSGYRCYFDNVKVFALSPMDEYFMNHLGALSGKTVIYKRVVGGRTVEVLVNYGTIIKYERTDYCGLENMPPAFSIEEMVEQWKAGYSKNRMYYDPEGCWYWVYFPAIYRG